MRSLLEHLLPALVLAVAPPAARGEAPFDPLQRAATIAPLIDHSTVAVAHVDLSRLDVPAILAAWSPEPDDEASRTAHLAEFQTLLAQLQAAGVGEVYAVIDLADLSGNRPLLAAPLAENANLEVLQALLAPYRFQAIERHGQLLLAGGKAAVERARTMLPAERPELAAAFEAAGDTAAQLVVVPSDDHRRAIEELLPTLPAELGGGPSTDFTRGLRWAAVGADLPPELSLRLVVQSADAAAAEQFAAALPAVFPALSQHRTVALVLPNLAQVAELLAPRAEGDRLTRVLNDDNGGRQAIAALLAAAKLEARRHRSLESLRQIVLAMHTYHDRHNHLPPAANYDAEGRPLLSWRVHVLAHSDCAGTYEAFHLDEPWDSEHNRQLIRGMPEMYRSPHSQDSADYTTPFLAVTGEGMAFERGVELTLRDFTEGDGSSNTILVVEADADRQVIWTKPEEWEFNPEQPPAGLGHTYPGVFHAGFGDASTRAMSLEEYGDRLRAFFTRAAGDYAF